MSKFFWPTLGPLFVSKVTNWRLQASPDTFWVPPYVPRGTRLYGPYIQVAIPITPWHGTEPSPTGWAVHLHF